MAEDTKAVQEISKRDYLLVTPGAKIKVAPFKDFIHDHLSDLKDKKLIFTEKKDLSLMSKIKNLNPDSFLIVGAIFGDIEILSLKESELVDFIVTFRDDESKWEWIRTMTKSGVIFEVVV